MTKKEYLIAELSKENEQVLGLAYMYAINFHKYGVDVTKAITNAMENTELVQRAYMDGVYDALKRLRGE